MNFQRSNLFEIGNFCMRILFYFSILKFKKYRSFFTNENNENYSLFDNLFLIPPFICSQITIIDDHFDIFYILVSSIKYTSKNIYFGLINRNR